MLSLFKKREYPRSKFEWHALVRHYGGLSRLLDVTSSYLVGSLSNKVVAGLEFISCYKKGVVPSRPHTNRDQKPHVL